MPPQRGAKETSFASGGSTGSAGSTGHAAQSDLNFRLVIELHVVLEGRLRDCFPLYRQLKLLGRSRVLGGRRLGPFTCSDLCTEKQPLVIRPSHRPCDKTSPLPLQV